MNNDFFAVQSVIDAKVAQCKSVAGKATPYRVEFRYGHGRSSYQYFADLESARNGTDRSANYGPTGRAVIKSPTSTRIQIQGPRGGWKKLQEDINDEQD